MCCYITPVNIPIKTFFPRYSARIAVDHWLQILWVHVSNRKSVPSFLSSDRKIWNWICFDLSSCCLTSLYFTLSLEFDGLPIFSWTQSPWCEMVFLKFLTFVSFQAMELDDVPVDFARRIKPWHGHLNRWRQWSNWIPLNLTKVLGRCFDSAFQTERWKSLFFKPWLPLIGFRLSLMWLLVRTEDKIRRVSPKKCVQTKTRQGSVKRRTISIS